MSDEQRQADLLEQYLNALAQDSRALPPPDLDRDSADFAWLLAQQMANPPLEDGQRERLWVQSLANAIQPHNSNGKHDDEHEWESHSMTTMSLDYQDKRSMLPYTLVAAVVTLVALGAILLAAQNLDAPDSDNQAALMQLATDTPTATPLATVVPTVPPPANMSGGGGGGGNDSVMMPDMMQSIEAALQANPPTEIVLGESYTGEVTAENPYITFSYVAPEAMTLVTLAEVAGFAANVGYEVRSKPVETPFGGGGGGGGGGGPLQSPQLTTLNTGDTVSIVFYSQQVGLHGSDGSYRIRFERLQPTTIDPGTNVDGSIDAEHPYQAYRFDVNAGDIFSVRQVDGFDTRLDLRSASGQVYLSDDDGGTGYNPEIYRQMTAVDDAIFVVVSPALSGQTGDFSLSVDLESAPVFTTGAIQLTSKAPRQVLRLNGEAGTIQVLRLRPQQPDHSLTVQFSDGETVMHRAQSEGLSEMVMDVIFPESGKVIITIEEVSQQVAGSDFVLDVQIDQGG